MNRTTLKTLTATTLCASLLAVTPAISTAGTGHGTPYGASYGEKPASRADIVDTAISAGQFNTLAKALTAAGLVDTLRGTGPFTVFAPTDAAFAKIPADKLNALLADKEALTKILTYHVVPGRILARDVRSGEVRTAQGQPITIKTGKAGIMVNDARVVKTDVLASNGVIHVIDTVILPN
jgi:uncharacterized surface protein with fasciclin (FAS1) repeats